MSFAIIYKMVNDKIDGGKSFDWGKTSEDYAKFRDIYPDEFYERITARGLCVKGQSVLDLGTGTGVLPRNMQKYGAKWTGVDIAENQIEQARRLSEGMDIDYYCAPVEELSFPEGSFDVVTACQCFWYFEHETLIPKLCAILKDGGCVVPMEMEWLPFEDDIALQSENLVLKYNPKWSGAGYRPHEFCVPECYSERLELVYHEEFRLPVRFTRESWNGRMKACRGVGASLSEREIREWEKEHLAMLEKTAPEEFDVAHFAAFAVLRKK